jgi:hypothetical protein
MHHIPCLNFFFKPKKGKKKKKKKEEDWKRAIYATVFLPSSKFTSPVHYLFTPLYRLHYNELKPDNILYISSHFMVRTIMTTLNFIMKPIYLKWKEGTFNYIFIAITNKGKGSSPFSSGG